MPFHIPLTASASRPSPTTKKHSIRHIPHKLLREPTTRAAKRAPGERGCVTKLVSTGEGDAVCGAEDDGND